MGKTRQLLNMSDAGLSVVAYYLVTIALSRLGIRRTSLEPSRVGHFAPPSVLERGWIVPAALAVSLVAGCKAALINPTQPTVQQAGIQVPPALPPAVQAKAAQPPASDKSVGEQAKADASPETPPKPEIRLGTGRFVQLQGRASTAAPAAMIQEGDITLNFQGADLHEVIKVILGDVLKLNYVVDPNVLGAVTIQTSRPLSRDALLPVLDTILQQNGATLKKLDGFYRIEPLANAARSASLARARADAGPLGYRLQIVPLRFIAADEMHKLLEPFLPVGGLALVDRPRNLLMLGGTPTELDRVLDTVDVFDVDWLKGMSVGLFPLQYVDPKALVTEIEQALGGKNGEIFGGLVRLVAIERLNSVLAVSTRAEALVETHDWIARLDRRGTKAGPRLFVYRLRNAKATDLAAILNGLYGTSQPSAAPTAPAPRLAPGLEPVQLQSTPYAQGAQPESLAPATPEGAGLAQPQSEAPGAPQDLAVQGSSVRIIADPVHNALVVLATAQEYEIIEEAIRKLDLTPLQVLVEATIIEVSLTNALEYGVQWFFKNNFGAKQGRGLLDLNVPGLAPLVPGFSYAVVDNVDQVRVILNALDSTSKLNVLSSPSLMVLDNQLATINVGDEIPIPTRQSVSNVDPNAPTVNEIEYRSTGVILSVVPHVNEGGLITMEVQQEVSDAVTTVSSTLDAPTIQQRRISSVVAVNSGETLILGGLIRNNITRTKDGVPVLHRLPVVGNLFGETSKSERRTELMVLLTPRAVANPQEARQVTDEFRRKLKSLEPNLSSGQGPVLESLP